jgi:hypothetical protein
MAAAEATWPRIFLHSQRPDTIFIIIVMVSGNSAVFGRKSPRTRKNKFRKTNEIQMASSTGKFLARVTTTRRTTAIFNEIAPAATLHASAQKQHIRPHALTSRQEKYTVMIKVTYYCYYIIRYTGSYAKCVDRRAYVGRVRKTILSLIR